jgi:hypothetical protein
MDSSQKKGCKVAIQKSTGFSMNSDPRVKHPEAIEADYQMKDVMLVLDMRAPLVGYALRRWAVDCTPNHVLDPRSHHLYLSNPQTLYGVESAALVPGFSALLK